MHYNNYAELLFFKARVDRLEEELLPKVSAVAIRMLHIDRELGLHNQFIPKNLYFPTDMDSAPYNKHMITVMYDPFDHPEYVLVPVDYVFSEGDWEATYRAQQEPKAQLKRNADAARERMYKKFVESYKKKKANGTDTSS